MEQDGERRHRMSDTISRETVKEWLNSIGVYGYDWQVDELPPAGQIMTATSNTVVSDTVQIPVMDGTTGRLPSAERKGKWIRITQGEMPEQYICPFCHRTVETYGVEELLPIRYPYCHCGADMRGEEE